jgi:putative transposase
MRATKSLKFELDGETKDFRSADGQSRICNWLYNCLGDIAKQKKADFVATGNSQVAKTVYSKRGLRNLLPALKKEHPFLKAVHSSPLKNTALRLSSAIQAHQKGKKRKVGWPRPRSWKAKWFSLFYDEPKKGFKVFNDVLTISLGQDEHGARQSLSFRLKGASALRGCVIRNLRIVREASKYYAIFTVYVDLPDQKPLRRVIALDPNHKNLVVGVDTEGTSIEVETPYWLKNFDKRIDELKSKRDRCCKKAKKLPVLDTKGVSTGKEYTVPSRRWQKLQKTLDRALRKRREQTKTFMFTVAHRLCQNYDCIGIGDYAPSGQGISKAMRRAMNNRSLIGRFKEVLSWTAKKSGKVFVEYDETGTTRTCFDCHYVIEGGLDPSIRRWICPGCQTNHIRDENAAKNGLTRVLQDPKCETFVSQVPSSGLVTIRERWAWCVRPSGILTTPWRALNRERSQRQVIKTKA